MTTQQHRPDRNNRGTAVLLVADKEAVRDLIREILEEHGFRVLEAVDAKQAGTLYSSQAVDVAVCDWNATERDEWIESVRRGWPAVKIIAMSGAFGQSLLAGSTLEGIDMLLKKPFSCESLVESVERLLARPEDPNPAAAAK